MRIGRMLLVLGAVACLAGIVAADDFVDTFENYTLGKICGQAGPPGGWEEWEGSSGVCGDVVHHETETGVPANSGEQSFRIVGVPPDPNGDDTVQPFDIREGVWTFTIQTFAPNDATGAGWVIMLNQYPANLNWSFQVGFNADTNTVYDDDCGTPGPSTPLIRGEWVEYRVEIDLDQDVFNSFYGDFQLVKDGIWSDHVCSPGLPQIQALDLWAADTPAVPPWPPGTSGFYLDDASLEEVQPITGCEYTHKKNSKAKKGCNLCYKKGDTMMSGQACEKVKDCTPKKIKEKTYECLDPVGVGFCKKLKWKRSGCIE